MRLLIPVFLCLLALNPAFAYDTSKEQRAYQEAMTVYEECNLTSYMTSTYDCRCVAGAFYNSRLKDVREGRDTIIGEILPQCPNLPQIAVLKYKQCVEWAKLQRPADYDDYCKCYGATFAKSYEGQPVQLAKIEKQVAKSSLKYCNQMYPLKERTPAENQAFRNRLEKAILD